MKNISNDLSKEIESLQKTLQDNLAWYAVLFQPIHIRFTMFTAIFYHNIFKNYVAFDAFLDQKRSEAFKALKPSKTISAMVIFAPFIALLILPFLTQFSSFFVGFVVSSLIRLGVVTALCIMGSSLLLDANSFVSKESVESKPVEYNYTFHSAQKYDDSSSYLSRFSYQINVLCSDSVRYMMIAYNAFDGMLDVILGRKNDGKPSNIRTFVFVYAPFMLWAIEPLFVYGVTIAVSLLTHFIVYGAALHALCRVAQALYYAALPDSEDPSIQSDLKSASQAEHKKSSSLIDVVNTSVYQEKLAHGSDQKGFPRGLTTSYAPYDE